MAVDGNQLALINIRVAEWEQRRDAEAIEELNALISPDLVFRRADETVIGKEEFMAGLLKPSPFSERGSEDVAVEIRDDRALVTVTVTTVKADGTTGRYRNIRLFVRRNSDWRLEFWFNDDITHL